MYFKEEIQADNVLFIPKAEQVNAVWNAERIQAVRQVKKDEFIQKDNSSFAQVFEQEQKKQMQNSQAKLETQDVTPDKLYENGMNYYNNKAMTTYFYMTYSTADFKG